MVISIVMAAIGVMTLFPRTPAGRALRRLLVEIPAERLNRLRRGHLALALLLAAMLAAAVAMGREGFVVAGQAPEVVAWFAAFDIATYVEVITAGLVVAAAVRFRGAISYAKLRLSQAFRGRARHRRPPTRKRTPPADPDGDPWPAALAFAQVSAKSAAC